MTTETPSPEPEAAPFTHPAHLALTDKVTIRKTGWHLATTAAWTAAVGGTEADS